MTTKCPHDNCYSIGRQTKGW